MPTDDKRRLLPSGRRAISLSGVLFLLLFLPILPVLAPSSSFAQAENSFVGAQKPQTESQGPLVQGNSFLESSPHYLPQPELTTLETIPVIATAYSSSVWETDDTPSITASGTRTRDGIIASNLLPFNTKIRIPELFGRKVFVVEDRMADRIGDFQIDIWFPSSWQARQFGVKNTYIETLK